LAILSHEPSRGHEKAERSKKGREPRKDKKEEKQNEKAVNENGRQNMEQMVFHMYRKIGFIIYGTQKCKVQALIC
jgi:hypothetical protein